MREEKERKERKWGIGRKERKRKEGRGKKNGGGRRYSREGVCLPPNQLRFNPQYPMWLVCWVPPGVTLEYRVKTQS